MSTSPAKDALQVAIRDIGRTCGRHHVPGYSIDDALIVVPLPELLDALALNEHANDAQLLDRTRNIFGKHLITLQDAAMALASYLPEKHTLRRQITFLRVAEKEGKLAQPAMDDAFYPAPSILSRDDGPLEWRIGQSEQALKTALRKKAMLPVRVFDIVTGLAGTDDLISLSTINNLLHPVDVVAYEAAQDSDAFEVVKVGHVVFLKMASLVAAFFHPPPSGQMMDVFEDEEEDEIDSGDMATVQHKLSFGLYLYLSSL